MQSQAKDIAQQSNSSFYYAFSLLPANQREAMNTVYAFCRQTDDIVDEGDESTEIKYQKLREWREELELALKGASKFSLLNRLSGFIRQFNIPIDPFFDLIKGMEMDLQTNRYLSFEDLRQYCYRVASTVGLMCIEIFGYKNKGAREYAINLGLAMQLTNILRDISEDKDMDRIYIPQEEIRMFGLDENHFFEEKMAENFKNLMKFQVDRAHSLYDEADKGIKMLDRDAQFAIYSASKIYRGILRKIELQHYDPFRGRVFVPQSKKVQILIGEAVRTRIFPLTASAGK